MKAKQSLSCIVNHTMYCLESQAPLNGWGGIGEESIGIAQEHSALKKKKQLTTPVRATIWNKKIRRE